MRTQLLSHNKIAYRKVMKAFETSDRTCVVHPTGTGKSYLIAAVSESYKRVLILAPNIFVLNQVREVLSWRKDDVEYMTYTTLMLSDDTRTDYDLVCLDEFHRAGAPEWGDAVINMLKVNPHAKVLGTTATPVRDCDDNRNMADELFDGNIASVMSIAEAWNRNILPVPTYVTGLFDFNAATNDLQQKINTSKYLTNTEKHRRLTRLNNMRLDWERSEGMPHILRKYLDDQCRRVLVFCASVDLLEQMERTVCGWFRKAGFTLSDVCLLHTYLSDRQQEQAMANFQSDKGNGIKLMFSVNMLNEGVHVPRVNAVLMLRTTSSRIVYMQQLGRCLTAANTDKPVVFDMVDNMTQTNIIHVIREEFNQLEQLNNESEDIPREFVIHDHCRSYREMVFELSKGTTNNWNSDEEVVERILQFINQHGRLPLSNTTHEERKLYLLMMSRREAMEANATINGYFRLLRKQGDAGVEQNIALIKDFIAEHGRLPHKGESPFFGKWRSLMQYQKDHPDVIAIQRDYSARRMTDFEATAWAERIIDFIAQNGRQPNHYHGREEQELGLKLRVLAKSYPTRPKVHEMMELAEQFRILSDAEIAEAVIRFERENGRMPNFESERSLYTKFRRRRERLKATNQEIKKLCDKYYITTDTPQQRTEKLRRYCEEHGHLPSRLTAPEEFKNIMAFLRQHPTPEFVQLMQQYAPVSRLSKEELSRRLTAIRKYCEEHGHLPIAQQGEQIWEWWSRLKTAYKDHPEVKRLIADYPRKMDIIKAKANEKAARKKAEREKRKQNRGTAFTVKQNKLRTYGRLKYGYVPADGNTPETPARYYIYYTPQTRRMDAFEKSCKAAGLTIKELP